ncbi:PaaX family transcriptional regulator [Corynebacterium sp. YIM 101645]|uniref:PaaX family transcriptional regulator n=1 Tax=Corynebacterium lemuris TaxID=1859292 RepID=A0ABT2FWA9_9CORY|nr:PaaX family transcriptional regulator [Corynebacterium lemuris]
MTTAFDEFISGRVPGQHSQAAHHRFLITLFGLYARPAGKSIPISQVVDLMSDLDLDPASVRSSVSRLKKKGVLVPDTDGGDHGYALAAELEKHLVEGDQRIFFPKTQDVHEPWLLVSYTVPETQRKHRNTIRTGLIRMGFGTVAAGLFIAPLHLRHEAADYMTQHGLSEFVDFFSSTLLQPSDLRKKVAEWWDLEELEGHYREFLDAYEPLAAEWKTNTSTDLDTLRRAFQTYVPMITHWRRLPYLDPGLSPELLPENWAGSQARQVFHTLHDAAGPLSESFMQRSAR